MDDLMILLFEYSTPNSIHQQNYWNIINWLKLRTRISIMLIRAKPENKSQAHP
uniref:Uncharacterized protein n=1 Tax=Rhizophora mucronata TaxID=61149 RepID=A0A2P2PD33_RHIMU